MINYLNTDIVFNMMTVGLPQRQIIIVYIMFPPTQEEYTWFLGLLSSLHVIMTTFSTEDQHDTTRGVHKDHPGVTLSN